MLLPRDDIIQGEAKWDVSEWKPQRNYFSLVEIFTKKPTLAINLNSSKINQQKQSADTKFHLLKA